MTYQEILTAARTCIGPYCKACPVCNGRACKNTMPGPGAKGTGTVAARNYDAWQDLCLNMDTICENGPVDTRFTLRTDLRPACLRRARGGGKAPLRRQIYRSGV